MFRLVSSASTVVPSVATAAAATQKRTITRLHTSYHRGFLRLHNLSGPRAAAKGAAVTSALRSKYFQKAPVAAPSAAEDADFEAASEDVDVLNHKKAASAKATPAATAERPFVPLSAVSRIELQGDYLMEGGQPFDALRYYGVVAKAYGAAYPENDNQRAMITVKLSRAFRCCGMADAAVENAEHALYMLDHNASPHIDLVCEALVELGEAKASRGDKDAGLVYEDVLNIIDTYHSMGNSERTIRLMPRLGVRMGIGHDKKFFYLTPFDTDRVFHLGDHAMSRAEAFYRSVEDQEGIVRVLERRAQLINTKFFEHHDVAGRIRTLRGYSGILKRSQSFGMTPRELFTYSPTIHQVYLDRSVNNVAPLGREDEVMPGANRRVMDDGHYARKRRHFRAVSRPVTSGKGVNSMSSIYDY